MQPVSASDVRRQLFGRWKFVSESLLDLLAVAEENELERSLSRVRRLEDAGLRVEALAVIAHRLHDRRAGPILEEALETARALEAPWCRAKALASVARALTLFERQAVIQEVVVAIRMVVDGYWRAAAIQTVADLDALFIPQLADLAESVQQPAFASTR
jgi:hypothetical protein